MTKHPDVFNLLMQLVAAGLHQATAEHRAASLKGDLTQVMEAQLVMVSGGEILGRMLEVAFAEGRAFEA